MKRKVITVTEEFDKDGKIVSRITETTEEEDNGYIYPQHQTYPCWPSAPTCRPNITCDSSEQTEAK